MLIDIFLQNSIRGQAHPPLEQETVIEIAKRHKKTPGQVLLRHAIQRGVVTLVKSSTPERIKSNFDVGGKIYDKNFNFLYF